VINLIYPLTTATDERIDWYRSSSVRAFSCSHIIGAILRRLTIMKLA